MATFPVEQRDGALRERKGLGKGEVHRSSLHCQVMLLTAYALRSIIDLMEWAVAFHETFADEFLKLDPKVRQELAAHAALLSNRPSHQHRRSKHGWAHQER